MGVILRRLPPSARRLLGTLGAAVAGLALATTITSPAGATETVPDIRLDGDCWTKDTAQYEFALKVADGKALGTIRLKDKRLCDGVSQDFSLVSYITPAKGFALPQQLFDSKTITLTGRGTQNGRSGTAGGNEKATSIEISVPACYTQVDFVFGAEVINPLTDTSDRYGGRKLGDGAAPGNRAHVKRPNDTWLDKGWYNGGEERCKAKPKVEFTSSCVGEVKVHMSNSGRANIPANFVVTGTGGFRKTFSVAPDGFADTTVPAASAGDVKVEVGGKTERYSWKRPVGCAVPVPTGTRDCDKLTISQTNPADGDPIEVHVTTNSPAHPPRTTPLAPNASFQAVFPVAPGLVVTVTNRIGDRVLNSFQFPGHKPDNCPSPSTSPTPSASVTPSASASASVPPTGTPTSSPPPAGGGGGGGLPVTGDNVGLMVSAGGGLLALGAGLFFLARRRGTKFTS